MLKFESGIPCAMDVRYVQYCDYSNVLSCFYVQVVRTVQQMI